MTLFGFLYELSRELNGDLAEQRIHHHSQRLKHHLERISYYFERENHFFRDFTLVYHDLWSEYHQNIEESARKALEYRELHKNG